MARYWPWRGEIVMGGRPFAEEFLRAEERALERAVVVGRREAWA